MPTIDYTSGNLDNSERVLVQNIKPNVRYELSFDSNIEHLKSDNNPSQLVYTSEVVLYPSSFYTAPSDNVYADIELVRNGNSIDVNLLDFDYQNYTDYNYIFSVKAFSNSARTSQVKSVSFNNNTVPDTSKSMTISDFDTRGYYFQAQDFENKTAITDVYADRTAKESGTKLTLKVYDIRGLAYMRDLNFSSPPQQLTTLTFSSPGDVFLSAEGTRMMVFVFTSSGLTVSKYRMKKGDWDLVDTFSNGTSFRTYRYAEQPTYGVAAFSEYGDKYVTGAGSMIRIYNFETDSEIKAIVFSVQVQCITMSADNTRVLVSGNYAIDASGSSLTGNTGGTAKIYHVESGSEIANLGSSMIESFDNTLYYGSDSALSGDGNTAVVFGSRSTSATAFVWKLNTFSGSWEIVATLDIPGNHAHRTPCSFSHDGKALVVCGNDNTIRIFNTDDYSVWNEFIARDWNFKSCDISGDGKTVLFGTSESYLKVYTYNGTTWSEARSQYIASSGSFNSCALSYDGSTVCLQNNNTYTVQFDKNVTINTVYDYFNLKSDLYFNYNYSIDYENDIDTAGSWDITEQPLTIEVNDTANNQARAYYGYWDSTSISADGRFVLVGAPMDRKVYLYDTQKNEVTHTFSGDNTFFGLRCAMDDFAKLVVIVSSTNIYFYERSAEGFTQKGSATSHGYSSIFQFKMSKDGSTVLLTSSITSTEIKMWYLGTDWTTVPGSTTLSNGTKRVSAIDLSYNGDYIVAGQQTGGTTGDLTVFYPIGGKLYVTVNTGTSSEQLYLHSVAISSVPNASEEYTIIVGLALSYGDSWTSAKFKIYKFNKTTKTLSSGISYSVYGLLIARYGRTAAMSYDGNFALLSGTVENNQLDYHKGGAVLINTSTGDKMINLHYEPTVTFSGSNEYSGFLENKFNGFGCSCRISSDNRHILVGGGGYAFKYSAINTKTLYFPFTSDGTSTDSAFTFSAGGSYNSADGLTLGTGGSVNIQLNNDFQFSNTAGFIFSFEAKTSSTATQTAIRITVDSSFVVGVKSWGTQYAVTFAKIYNADETAYILQESGVYNPIYDRFISFYFRFNYDENIAVSNANVVDVPYLLGTAGFKNFNSQSVLTIYSQFGGSIRHLRMYAFD